nr:hypothetical protein [uncultured Flavobacterium sp.]
MINNVAFLLIFIFIFTISKAYYVRSNKEQKVLLVLLFFVHFMAMSLAYYDDIIDANDFYEIAKNGKSWLSVFGLGSKFMAFLIYPLVKIGISKFVLYFLFSSISFQAFLWYFQQMGDVFSRNAKIIGIPITQLFLLLPSLHYWSGYPGKDALVFFFLTYFLFEVKKKERLNFMHGFVSVVLLILRPHVFVATFIAFFVFYLFQKEVSKVIKLKRALLAVLVCSLSIPILMHFVRIKQLGIGSILEKWNELNAYALHTGSGVDLQTSSYLDRIWLLLFRPLFYDSITFYQSLVSIENGLVLLLFIWVFFYLYSKRKVLEVKGDVRLALLVACSIFLMIASYIYNLGLASRMRLMFMPLFFYALHQLVYCNEVKKE